MSSTGRVGGAGPGTTNSGDPNRWTAVLLQWRNWSLLAKLATIALIPLVFAAILGGLTIHTQLTQVQKYSVANRLVTFNDQIRVVVSALQAERTQAAMSSRQANAAAATKVQKQTDATVKALRSTAGDNQQLDQMASMAWMNANDQLGKLGTIRQQWQSNPDSAIGGYTDAIDQLQMLDSTLGHQAQAGDLAEPTMALYDIDASTEEISQQQAIVLLGIARGSVTPAEADLLRASQARQDDKVNDFTAMGEPSDVDLFKKTVTGSDITTRDQLVKQAIDNAPTGDQAANSNTGDVSNTSTPLNISAQDYNAVSDSTTSKYQKVATALVQKVHDASANLQSNAGSGLTTAAAVLFSALPFALVAVWLIARQLLSSIGALNRGARDVAAHKLPQAVADIRAGNEVSTEVEPIPVETHEEVGQLARSFDAVHREARRLAVEQATLRARYAGVFVNLSRRSQSLVQRQLRLIEQLERDEENPDQLSALFQLDHLATRMRRNNENLMVLSGSDSVRGSQQQPIPLADLLRAAVSEIEQYQRVVVQPPPSLSVLGYAASDLVRLVAELLDNATAFSSPDTQVSVSSHHVADGAFVIDIVDHGIGMRPEDLAAANEALAAADTDEVADVPVTRRMGLFVVARLSLRHGVRVRLHPGDEYAGLRASVTVPASLIVGVAEPAGGLGLLGGAYQQPVRPTSGLGIDGVTVDDDSAGLAGLNEPTQVLGAEHGVPRPSGYADAFGHAAAADVGGGLERGVGHERGVRFHDDHADDYADVPAGHDVDADVAEPSGIASTLAGGAAAAGVVGALGYAAGERRGAQQPGPAERLADEHDATAAGQQPQLDGRRGAVADALSARRVDGPPIEAASPATDLFRPAKADEPAADAVAPQTPIFDEMVSAWFAPSRGRHGAVDDEPDDVVVPGASASSGASAAQPERFSSPADAGWKTADEVLRSTPDGFTAAGLPKRKPRARLVPGSASAPDSLLNQAPSTSAASTSPTTPATSAAEPATPRDAEQTRSRMSSFQRGLRDGRAQVVRDDSGTVSTRAQSTRAQSNQTQSNQAQTDRTQTNRTQTSRALPDDRASDRPASIGRDNVASESDPTTRIDAGIIAASGLPKRTPRAHTNGTAPSTRAAASTSQPEPTSSPTEASTSRMPAPATSPTAAPSVSREPGELHWGTVADDGWQTADQVHRQEPEGFTAAGLPKRTPRARLVPGSVASGTRRVTSGAGGSSGQGESTSAQFGSTRTAVADQPAGFSRDANAVRSRLSSFQRGLREGRHTVRTPAGDRAMDGNH